MHKKYELSEQIKTDLYEDDIESIELAFESDHKEIIKLQQENQKLKELLDQIYDEVRGVTNWDNWHKFVTKISMDQYDLQDVVSNIRTLIEKQ